MSKMKYFSFIYILFTKMFLLLIIRKLKLLKYL